MNNQISTIASNADFKVNMQTGEAYISQRKLAELLNVSKSAISGYISRAVKDDTSQGLTAEIMQSCVQYYALDCANPTEEAKELLRKIATAGAKAYLYHKAGYSVSASPVKPMALPVDYVSALRALADETEQKIMLLEENTEKRIATDEGDEYFSVKRIKDFNQGAIIGGVKLAKSAAKLGIPAKPMFDHYDFVNPVTWHVSVWLDAYPQLNYPE